MLILLLLFFLIFPSKLLAAPTIIINPISDVITAGTTFPIIFTINEASSSASYYYKFFGGIGTDVYTIKSDSALSYNSSWTNFPQITLNPNTSNIFNAYAYVNPDAITGNYNFKLKIALISNTGIGFTSPSVTLDIAAVPPTPIPTSTPIPTATNTPTPTNTPTTTPTIKPTATPTIDLNKYTPSAEATASVILEPTIITNTPTEKILTNTPTPNSGSILGEDTKTKQNFLPLIFICLGAIFLLAPLIIAKIKPKL